MFIIYKPSGTWLRVFLSINFIMKSYIPSLIGVLLLAASTCAVAQTYCTSQASSSGGLEITSVVVGTLSNASDCGTTAPGAGSLQNRYSNYTGTDTLFLSPGDFVEVEIGYDVCSASDSAIVAVYLDYNQDGYFSLNELVFQETDSQIVNSPGTVEGSFVVPVTGLLEGYTGLRVIAINEMNGPYVPECGVYDQGETEDYTVHLTESACSTVPSITGIVADATCSVANGAIDVSVTGGLQPYSLQWSNGATMEDMDSLIAGAYSFTVTDADGCTASQNYFVLTDSMLVTGTITNAVCSDSSGSIALVINGTAPYTITWSTGQTQVYNIDNLPAGNYSVTVYDANGCYDTAAFTINNASGGLMLTGTVIPATSNLWNIETTISGGTPPYTFYWDNGAVAQNLVNVTDGWYCVDVTDAEGCSAGHCFNAADSACIASFIADYCLCDTFSLILDSMTEAQGGTYFWDFGDGATSTAQFPVHAYEVDGIYTVCLTHTIFSDNCTYCHDIGIDSLGNVVTRMDADGFVLNVVPFGFTGVEYVATKTFLELYPNPVGNQMTLRFETASAGYCELEIHNAVGQKLRSFFINTVVGLNTVEVPTYYLSQGFYSVTMTLNGAPVIRSFVK